MALSKNTVHECAHNTSRNTLPLAALRSLIALSDKTLWPKHSGQNTLGKTLWPNHRPDHQCIADIAPSRSRPAHNAMQFIYRLAYHQLLFASILQLCRLTRHRDRQTAGVMLRR